MFEEVAASSSAPRPKVFAMSELRSAVDAVANALSSHEVTEVPDALVEEDFAELMRAEQLISLWQARYLVQLDRRRSFEREGHLSLASWLAARFRIAWGMASRRVKLARALQEMPVAREAAESGEVSMSQVDLLARARDAEPVAFAEAEVALVDAARAHSVGGVRRVVGHWREAVERSAKVDSEQRLRDRRHLHASATFEGMVRTDGDLDPDNGEAYLTALRAVMDAECRSEEDDRTPAQRRADALGEICRQWLDRSDRPEVAGERPHVTVTLDASVLAVVATPNWSDNVHDGPVRRRPPDPAGDASIIRIVLAAPSEPVDVGRRTPVVPPAMRRAVVVRDRHCRFPGCDRPHSWCDAHHVVLWAGGGETKLSNLLLLCRRHHRMVHDSGGITLSMSPAGPAFRRADGSPLGSRGGGGPSPSSASVADRAPP
jgi:Domain of unknown function (DUF222)